MPTTVPIPARARASYIVFGPEVPPVILHSMRPQRESLRPTMIWGRALLLAASLYSGSPMRTSTMSLSLFGSLAANSSVR